MKKLLTAIATAVFIVFASLCFASYIIHLKSGHSFQTDRYWEEGAEIKFKRYGGVVGIRKELVKDIEEVEDLPREKEEPAGQETPEATKEGGSAKQEATEKEEKVKDAKEVEKHGEPEKISEEEKGAAEKGQTERPIAEEGDKKRPGIDVERYKREKRVLTENYLRARQKLKEARGTRDKAKIRKSKKEIKRLEKELYDLALKAKKENGGVLPPWWFRVGRKEQVKPPQDRRE